MIKFVVVYNIYDYMKSYSNKTCCIYKTSSQFHVLSCNHVYNYYVCQLNPKRCKIDKKSYNFGCWTIGLNMNLLIFSTHVMWTHGNWKYVHDMQHV